MHSAGDNPLATGRKGTGEVVGRTADTKGQLLPHCWRFAEIDRGRLHPHALRGSNFRVLVWWCDFDAGSDCRASEKRASTRGRGN